MNLREFIVVYVRLLWLRLVTSSGYGAVLDRIKCDESYLECTLSDAVVDLLGSVAHPDNDRMSIKLYQSNAPLSWCQSYHMCKNLSSELAIIDDDEKQMAFENFNVSLTSGRAWVAGTRKNHGNGWTWVTSDLNDCEQNSAKNFDCSIDATDGAEFGYLANDHIHTRRIFASTYADSRPGVCTHDYLISITEKWILQQNRCFSERYRLATLDEAEQTSLPQNTAYYIGLMYRPWVWIQEDAGGCMLQPVLYSKWASALQPYVGSDMCISVNISEGAVEQWMEVNCASTLQYFFCEDLLPEPTTAPPTEPDAGSSSTASAFSTEAITDNVSLPCASYMTDIKILQGILGLFVALTCVAASVAIILGIQLRSSKSKKTEADPNTHDYYNMGPTPDNKTAAIPSDTRADLSGDYPPTAIGDTRIHTSGDGLKYETIEDPDRPYGSLDGNMRDPPEASSPTYASLQ